MSLAMFFTLCCFACTAVNDLIFKLFARKSRSRGLFVMIVGIAGSAAIFMLPDKTGDLKQTILWGTICGIFSAVGNIMLIESMSKLSAGVCSTVYRLNMALVVPLSVIFFNEKLDLKQIPGIILAIAAVILFMPEREKNPDRNSRKSQLMLPVILIISASIFRAGLGLSCKYGPMTGASANGISFIIELIWVISGAAYYFFKERRCCKPDKSVLIYGLISGVLVASILLFMIKALACEGANASIILPIAQMSFLATFLLSVFFLKEKVDRKKIAAIICGTGALLLLV